MAPHEQQTGASATVAARPTSLKATLKRLTRQFAKALFRLASPLGRPLAFRTRAYLNEPMQLNIKQLQQLQEQAARDLDAQAKSMRGSFERLLVSHSAQMTRDMQDLRAAHESSARSLTQQIAGLRACEFDRLSKQLERIEEYGHATARRSAVACGPGEVMVRTTVGYVLCPAEDAALISLLIESGELELGTRLLIQRLLKPGDCFVDVGANVGMLSVAAGKALGGRGRIVAFEPMPATHRLLQKTLWMNGLDAIAETYQAAVSNHAGTQALFLGATSGHHSLYPLRAQILEVSSPIDVPLVRLDDALGREARVDLLKIDVEGAELDVLEGAGGLIANNPGMALIVELGQPHLRRTGESTTTWLARFERFGLRFCAVNPDTGALEGRTVEDLERTPSINLLFARPDADAWARARTAP